MNKQDLQRWKQNEFTKFFLDFLQKEIETGERVLINQCLSNSTIEDIRKTSGGILALRKLVDIDEYTLNLSEEENE